MADKPDMLAQINELDISAMPDDISSMAPESTTNRLYQTQNAMPSTTSKYSRGSFMNFQSGKKSPLGRVAINRMTQNLVNTQKNQVARMTSFVEQEKSKVPVRDMWKSPEETEAEQNKANAEKKAKRKIKTVVKQVKDMEVFETEFADTDDSDDSDDSDSDADESLDVSVIEERKERAEKKQVEKEAKVAAAAIAADQQQSGLTEEKPDYGDLVKGVDFVDDEISTQKAFTVFRQLEEKDGMRDFKPPQIDSGGQIMPTTSRYDRELPSVRIQRMEKELESLQIELLELEKEELPSRMANKAQTAKTSLGQIDDLRVFMHNLVDSSTYQDLESRSNLDLKEVLQKAYSDAVPNKESAKNTQDLKQALQGLLKQNVAQLNPELARGSEVDNQIELYLQVDQSPDVVQKFKNDLIVEQHKKYMDLQTELDECEKLVGPWNPVNNITNIYDTFDQVHDAIDEFNEVNEESAKVAPTPTSQVPQTPGGSRKSANTISNKAKQFNQELSQLQTKFKDMEDVLYDQQKVQLVFDMTERALEQRAHFDIVQERLSVLEKMNKESPNLEAKLQRIVQQATVEIPQAIIKEQKLNDEVRNKIIESAKELDTLV